MKNGDDVLALWIPSVSIFLMTDVEILKNEFINTRFC